MNVIIEPRWYVVQSQPHSEGKAAAHLVRQGFFTYLPRYLKRRRHARRVETVAAPLFPRYLFVMMDQVTQRWRSIRSTVGVTDFVCSGDQPIPIARKIIDGLKSQEDERGWIRLQPLPRYSKGEKVKVVDGVFTTCVGIFDGMTDRDRVAILLEILGRTVRVVIDEECIEAA
jgi:transcriptional antiterminator RfaH